MDRTRPTSKALPAPCYWNDIMALITSRIALCLTLLPLCALAEVKLDTPRSGWRLSLIHI